MQSMSPVVRGLAWFAGIAALAAAGCGHKDTSFRSAPDAGADADSDADADGAPATDADADSDGDADAGGPAPVPCDLDGAPAPCAADQDADRDPLSDVSQVTKTVTPSFGEVPDGGAFAGAAADLPADGPYAIYQEALDIPIAAETRTAACHQITVSAGTIHGTAYLPKAGGQILGGPMPLVLVLPGAAATEILYSTYSNHLASHGFAALGLDTRSDVLAASHDREAVEVSQAIRWAVESDASPFKGRIDIEKIAAAGHSKGGKIAFFAAAVDRRIKIVIGWDPSNSGGPPCLLANVAPDLLECNALPVAPNCMAGDPGVLQLIDAESLVFGMPRDLALNPDRHHNAIHFYRGAPSPAEYVQCNAGHLAPLSNPQVVEIIKGVQLAFLLRRFMGLGGGALDPWLLDTPVGHSTVEAKAIVMRVETK